MKSNPTFGAANYRLKLQTETSKTYEVITAVRYITGTGTVSVREGATVHQTQTISDTEWNVVKQTFTDNGTYAFGCLLFVGSSQSNGELQFKASLKEV